MFELLLVVLSLVFATLIVAFVVIVATSLKSASSTAVLLTPAERRLHRMLRDILGDDYAIFPQTPISVLIEVDRSHPRANAADKIGAKTVDFTVCYAPKGDGAYIVAYCIELDDATHSREDRQARDAFVNRIFHEAGIPLIRIPARALRSKEEVRAIIRRTLRRRDQQTPRSPGCRSAYRAKSMRFVTTTDLEMLRRAMNVDKNAVIVPFVRAFDCLPRKEQRRMRQSSAWPIAATRIVAAACDRHWRVIAQTV